MVYPKSSQRFGLCKDSKCAADPKHLGARIGATAVLHSWGSTMTLPLLISAKLEVGDKIVSKALTPLSRYWSDAFGTRQLSAGGVPEWKSDRSSCGV